MNPVVAIIGRPNVGKSTFYNRLTRRRDALVDNMPGVTRDRQYGEVVWEGRVFNLVDTGGFISGDGDPFAGHIRSQVEQAVEEADAVILLLDGKHGLSPFDHDLIQRMRTLTKQVFYVVNKIDGPEQEERLYEFYDLGIERLFSLSAEHGYGVPDFMDALVAELPGQGRKTLRDAEIRIALVGRPNVGKSSLINRLLGQERLVVSEVAGTTRDAIDTICRREGRIYRLIDTAGIRRKSKVDLKVEKLSIIKSLGSMERCDVALIVLDAGQGIAEQDIRVAGYAHERQCGVVFVVNKWDLVDKRSVTIRKFEQLLLNSAKFLQYAPVLTVSATTGLRVNRLFSVVNRVFDQYTSRIGTGPLNRIVNEAVARNEPPMHKGKRLKFYYTTQISERPPTFVSFVNYPEAVHFSYQRFLANQIRAGTGLDLTPLRLYFRLRTGKIDFGSRDKKIRQRKQRRT